MKKDAWIGIFILAVIIGFILDKERGFAPATAVPAVVVTVSR